MPEPRSSTVDSSWSHWSPVTVLSAVTRILLVRGSTAQEVPGMVASDFNVPAPASSSAMLLSTQRTSAPALRTFRAMVFSPRTTLTTSCLSSPSYQAPAQASPSVAGEPGGEVRGVARLQCLRRGRDAVRRAVLGRVGVGEQDRGGAEGHHTSHRHRGLALRDSLVTQTSRPPGGTGVVPLSGGGSAPGRSLVRKGVEECSTPFGALTVRHRTGTPGVRSGLESRLRRICTANAQPGHRTHDACRGHLSGTRHCGRCVAFRPRAASGRMGTCRGPCEEVAAEPCPRLHAWVPPGRKLPGEAREGLEAAGCRVL